MIQFKKHIPTFIDTGERPDWVSFKTLEDLLEEPFIKRFSDDESFYRYSMSSEGHLIQEKNEGYNWWVIGYIKDPNQIVHLPKWEQKYGKKELTEVLKDLISKIEKSGRTLYVDMRDIEEIQDFLGSMSSEEKND